MQICWSARSAWGAALARKTTTKPLRVLGVLLLLGLSASARAQVVVLDPGHGGTNAGAIGPTSGLQEKTLTLDLARRVERYLVQWVPGVRVQLTRRQDRYLTLQQRVRLANALQATLFVSLHCNASPSHSQQGFETYILTRDASEREAARVTLFAQGEAEPVAPAQRAPSAPDRTLAAIVAHLQQNATHAGAAALARALQEQLRQARGPARDRGLRQAPFDVLLGLRMPGVLVEVGFIDHPLEGQQLAEVAVRERLAVAIAAGIAARLAQQRGQQAGDSLARVDK